MLVRLKRNLVLKAASKDQAPTERQLFAFGELDTSKGKFLFDQTSAALVMAAYEEQGVDLCFDYDHMAVNTDVPGAAPGSGKAAGWFKLEVRQDGLYAVDIKWTPAGKQLVDDEEYKYLSPAFDYDVDTGRILKLINCAITNLPATRNMKPLVASMLTQARLSGGMSFQDCSAALQRAIADAYCDQGDGDGGVMYGGENYPYLREVYDDFAVFEMGGKSMRVSYRVEGSGVALDGDAVEVTKHYVPVTGATTTTGAVMNWKILAKKLGLSENATEIEVLEALSALQSKHSAELSIHANTKSELLSLTGAKTDAEALGTIRGWKDAHAHVAELTGKLTKIEGERLEAEIDAAINQAETDRKVVASEKEFLRSMGHVSVEKLKAYLTAKPAVVPPPSGQPADNKGTQPGSKTTVTATLNDDDKRVLSSQFGIDPDGKLSDKDARIMKQYLANKVRFGGRSQEQIAHDELTRRERERERVKAG